MDLVLPLDVLDAEITADITLAEQKARTLTERAEQLREVRTALSRLSVSWRDYHAGKGNDYFFFVSEYAVSLPPKNVGRLPMLERCRHFHAEEVVSDLAEARLGAKERPWIKEETERKPVTLDTIANAKREPCPVCTASAYIIGEYAQTYDSPEGDTWEIQLCRLCMTCRTSVAIAHRADDHRISYLLSLPRTA